MELQGNTVLITGGSTGIGLALAEALLDRGNEVIVCARTEENLRRAKAVRPQLHTLVCDVSKEDERERLHDHVLSRFPEINILVNNAGIQRMVDLQRGTEDLLRHLRSDGEDEIDVNFKAYVYLAAHFIPDLLKRKEAAIINVSSGLGFVPIAFMPIYCATKSAIHTYTVCLRHQLKDTSIKVFEVIPPTVDTDLDKGARGRRGQTDRGIPPAEVARATLSGLQKNEPEIAIGMAQRLVSIGKKDYDQMFARMNH